MSAASLITGGLIRRSHCAGSIGGAFGDHRPLGIDTQQDDIAYRAGQLALGDDAPRGTNEPSPLVDRLFERNAPVVPIARRHLAVANDACDPAVGAMGVPDQ